MRAPRHPKALKYLHLFREDSFEQINQNIERIEEPHDRGAAFEVWTLGFLATQRSNDIEPGTLWVGKPPLEVLERLNLRHPKRDKVDYGVDGGWLNRQFGSDDVCQIKFKRGRGEVNWTQGNVGNFFGSADSPLINTRYVITNCYAVDGYATIRRGNASILGDELDRLSPEQLHQIAAWLEGEEIEIAKPFEPRGDQLQAVSQINEYLGVDDRTKCIMHCGTGKTFVGLMLYEDRLPALTLVLLPSLDLLRQTLAEWRTLQNRDNPEFVPLCVCSDDTVDLERSQTRPVPFSVTTSRLQVREFLDRPAKGPKVIFSTYHSSRVINDALQPGESFDLAIFDEAHMTTGWNEEERDRTLALDDRHIPIKKRVFFTATPRHCTTRERDENGEPKLVYSMNDERVYGRVAHQLSCRRAIELGIILPFKIIVSVTADPEVDNELLDEGMLYMASAPDGVWASFVANQIALAKLVKEFGIKKVFSFHRTIKEAEDFCSDKPYGIGRHLPGFKTRAISSKDTAERRKDVLDLMAKADRAVIANPGCLMVGVDVPSADAVALNSAIKSRINITQTIGRVQRKDRRNPDKKLGYVLLTPYVEIATGEDYLEALRRSKFDTVFEVLQTILEEDEPLREVLIELVSKKDIAGARRVLAPILEVRADFPHPLAGLDQLLEAIYTRCLDEVIAPFAIRWRQMYDQLVAYKEREGDCNVPYYCEDGVLHRWTVVQRKRQKEGVLSAERVRLLNEIGFCWDLDKATWDQFIKELRDHHAEHGNWSISQKTRLGRRLADVRLDWRTDELSPSRIDQLTAMGVPRDPRTALDEVWIQTVNELHALNWKVANETHRAFVGHQRSAKKKDKLAPEREAILSEKGFPWQPHAEAWEEMYERFCAWKKTGGKLDKRLKSWISNQRTEYAADRMPKEKAERLEKAGLFRDGTLDGRWQKRLEQYRAGDWSKAVLAWLVVQRQKYHGTRQGKLSDIQIAALEASPGFSWDPASRKDRDENCCAKGHAYTPENTYVHKDGSRRCRQCRRVTIDRRYKKNRPEEAGCTSDINVFVGVPIAPNVCRIKLIDKKDVIGYMARRK
jgi:superfamily II DNA or RNA helicase